MPSVTFRIELAHLLRPLKTFRKYVDNPSNDAIWSFSPGSIRIEWAGITADIPADGRHRLAICVKAALAGQDDRRSHSFGSSVSCSRRTPVVCASSFAAKV